MPDVLHSICVAPFRVLRKACALVHAHGDIGACGLFQEIKFTDDTAIMELRCHLWTVRVLVEQSCYHGRRFLAVGTGLQVQIFENGVNELRLRQHNLPIFLFLDFNTQKIADVSLIVDSELVGAGT